MQTNIRRGLLGTLFAGGLLALSCTAVSASEPLEASSVTAETSGDHSIASGNQIIAPVTAPVTVGAISTAVLGDSTAINKNGNKGAAAGRQIDAVTSGDHSIASGNQSIAPVTAPVTVGAISTAVLGDSTAINKNGNKGAAAGPQIDAVTSGDHSIASGNQIIAPVTAPVTVGAISTAVLGDSTAINKNGNKGAAAGRQIDAVTSGDHSIASGNQSIAPVTAPVTVGAISTAVLGDSTAINKNGNKGAAAGPQIDAVTSGDHSIASGNQIIAPVTAPVTVGAISTAVLGDSTAINKDDGYKNEEPKDEDPKDDGYENEEPKDEEPKDDGYKRPGAGPRIDAVTSGDHSIGSGNQVIAPVTAPVTVGAVSTAVLGDSTAINKGGGNHKGSAAGPQIDAETSGDHSIASGNQIIAPVTAPVTVGAISTAVLGDSTAINKGGGNHKDGNKGSAAGPQIDAVTSGDHSIASGNQIIAPVTAPVTVGAISTAVLGDSTAINKNGNHKHGV